MKTMEKNCDQMSVCGIEEVKLALFGDGNGNKGIVAMVKEMHEVFYNTKWTTKMALKFFGGLGIITGGIIGVWELIKRLK